MRKIIRYKGYEILHRHVFYSVFFQAWRGDSAVDSRLIRKDNRDIDWTDPLTDEEKDFLIKERENG